MSTVVSRHDDRVVRDEGDRFVKEFASRRDRDAEWKRLRWLADAGVTVPEVVATDGRRLVTRRLPGEPLDALIRTRWDAMPRGDRTRLVRRIADLCRRIRDAGFAWPDLVSYHLFVTDDDIAVLDPARLKRGKLELSALYWSLDEPTVSKSDRLRFWRAYAGDAPPPRIRRIGHRGRFRPYRWVLQRTEIRDCPRWAPFVDAIGTPYASADEIADHPDLKVKRTLKDRVNAELDDLVVKILAEPEEARREWNHHCLLMGAGFRVPQPAVGGVLRDGRGLLATVRLAGQRPLDDVWPTPDRRRTVRAVADVVRRLHAGGLVHKDLYLCHFFVGPAGDAPTLIDLARVTKTTARRKCVKDLAAVLHSARGLWTRTELWRGLRRYGGDKRLARAVLRKAERMARHVPRNVRDGTHVPHEPCT